jgi:signal transduction histidine kinase
MLDDKGQITFCNDALLRIANSTETLLNRNWLETIQEPRERDLWAALISEKFARSESQYHFEGALRFGDAAPRLLIWDTIVLRDPGGEGIALAAIGRDITAQRLLEARLAQTEKLEGIGRLAAGIAHDFNNLLTLIMGYVELGLERLESGSPLHKTLVGIASAASDCAVLTQQLLVIGRRQHLRPELLNLNFLIAGDEEAIRRIIGPGIDLVTILDPSIDLIWADPVQIRRILTNVAANSRDAMPNGGTLTIATANVAVGTDASRTGAPAGEYIRLTLSDTGIGLSEDVKRRLFEPFFTTKAPGKGHGLGLTTVYGIVSQSGGYISVHSPGIGTVVEILLPRSTQEPPDVKSSAG